MVRRPQLPANYERSRGWKPEYLIPKSCCSHINASGHPSGAAVQEFLVRCWGGGKIFVLSTSQADQSRSRKRYGCDSEGCKAQGTRLRTVKYTNPDTGEEFLVVETSELCSVHELNGVSTPFEFVNLEEYLLADDEEEEEDAHEPGQVPRNNNNNDDAQPDNGDDVQRNNNDDAQPVQQHEEDVQEQD